MLPRAHKLNLHYFLAKTEKRGRENLEKKKKKPVLAPLLLYVATMARSFAPFLSVLAALLAPILLLCFATMTHSEGQENFDLSALGRKGIRAYRDDINLPRGGEIGPELLKAI